MSQTRNLLTMPGHLIRRLNQHSTAIFTEEMRRIGSDLTSVQYAALVILRDNPGLDQTRLAAMIAADRATIGSVLRRLEQKGMIQRSPHDEDKRALQLHLTPAAELLIDAHDAAVRKVQSQILRSLSPAEQKVFLTLSEKIVQSQHLADRIEDEPC